MSVTEVPDLPAHRARSVLIVLLEALFDYVPALGSSVRRQPVAWSSTAWRVCPSCSGDGSVKRGRHRVECARCRGDGGWRIDPYDRQQAAAEAGGPVRVLSLPELERLCAPLDPGLPEMPGPVQTIVRAIDGREPGEDPDRLLDAIELQLRLRTNVPVFHAVELALIRMRIVAPLHRAVLVRVHVSQWQTVDQLSPNDRDLYDDAFDVLADRLCDGFTAPRWVRERALELEAAELERRDVMAAAGRWGSEAAKKERDRRIRWLVDERGWSARAVARHLRVSDRTVRRALERDEKAA